MKFRDRDEIVGPCEFIVVPFGVDHCPALDDACEVVLLRAGSTPNPGAASDARTTSGLDLDERLIRLIVFGPTGGI